MTALLQHRDAIAERATALHFKAHPELEARYGPRGRQKCREDSLHHLDYLCEAVARSSPALFTDYVAWAKVLLKALGIPGADLVENLRRLRQAAHEVGVGEPALALLDTTIAQVPAMPDEVASFIDPAQPHAPLARRYLDHMLAGRQRAASREILAAVDGGAAIKDIYLRVFQPVQYEIGRLWQMNRVTVAQEHVCTAATQLIMSQLYPYIFANETAGYTLVSACVADDLHEIGVRIVTDFFEMTGWDTHFVGASTPPGALAALVADVGAHVAALSVTMVAHIPHIEQSVAAIRATTPDVKILVGGYPFLRDAALYEQVGADGSACNAEEAVEVATRLLAQESAA